MALSYLTVQDMLWINLQITKRVQRFTYARLEEGTFYQYAYGESCSLFPQAARLVTGFLKVHPFEAGNEATALIACLVFLKINGCRITASDSQLAAWYEQVSRGQIEGEGAIAQIAALDEGTHHALVPDVRGTIRSVIGSYAGVVAELYDGVAKQPA